MSRATLPGSFKQNHGSGRRDVERGHLSRHRDAKQMVAGAADEFVQTGPLASQDNYGVGREVEAVVILIAALIEADHPEIALLERLEGADQIDHAGETEMLGGSGGGLDSDGAKGSGAALGEEDAVHARGFRRAKDGAEVLRIFDAVKGENEARLGAVEEVFHVEEVSFTNDGNDALMGGRVSESGECLAGLGTDFDARTAAQIDDLCQAVVVPFAGDADMVEAPAAGAKSLLDGVQAVQNFHLLQSILAGSLKCD